MPGPLVSVVIPFLDPPVKFLEEAVASVVAQDYRPLELLLVNDGSHACVAEAAKRLAKEVPLAARYVEHPGGANRGSSATRNLGGSLARGNYLAFLDADDVWVASKLREQVQILERDPRLAMVFGVTRYWYSWSGAKGPLHDFVVDRGVKRPLDIRPPEFVPLFLRGRIIVPSTSNSMIRREAFLDCGGFEESFRGMYDDQAFLVKLGLKFPVAAVPRCWDSYRQHPDSMTARVGNSGAESAARSTFLAWVRDYCDRHDISTPAVREAVNKEMWLVASPYSALVTHRMKRWWLRFEESLLPARLRRHIWCRSAQP